MTQHGTEPPDPRDPSEPLIEAAAGAWRPRGSDGGVRPHPAWHDLDDEGRVRAFELALRSRVVEAAVDAEGLSTTARAVLRRILGAR